MTLIERVQAEFDKYYTQTGVFPRRIRLSSLNMLAYEHESRAHLRYLEPTIGRSIHYFMGAIISGDPSTDFCRNCGATLAPVRCSYCGSETDYIEIES